MKVMQAKFFSIIALLLLCLLVEPSYAEKYAQYCNARFDYCVEYPFEFLYPQGEADNGDGQIFLSKDASVSMHVSGIYNALDESLENRYNADSLGISIDGARRVVAYKMLKKNYFVISGYVGKQIFYQKTLLINGIYKTLLIEYPVSLKKRLDPIVTYASHSFR